MGNRGHSQLSQFTHHDTDPPRGGDGLRRAPERSSTVWDYATWSRTLAAAKAGDAAAFAELFAFLAAWGERGRPHRPGTSAVGRRDQGVDFALYVTQDGLAHLRDVGPRGWRSYLHRARTNFAEKRRTRDGRHRSVEVLESELPARSDGEDLPRLQELLADGVDAAEVVLRNLDQEVLWVAMERLKREDRRLLYLRFWEELPVAEIARREGKPRGTVASRLHDILARLRRWLTGEEG